MVSMSTKSVIVMFAAVLAVAMAGVTLYFADEGAASGFIEDEYLPNGESDCPDEYWSYEEYSYGDVVVLTAAPFDETSSTDDIIMDYESNYYEKVELEDQGYTVEFVDENTYSEENTEIVSAMTEVMEESDEVHDDSNDSNFLVLVVEKLESKNEMLAADAVRAILDKRAQAHLVQAEMQQPNSKSRDRSLDDEDMGIDPFELEDTDDQEGVPDILGSPDTSAAAVVTVLPADAINSAVVLENRGCGLVF